MEKIKNYAIATLATCIIATGGASQNLMAKRSDLNAPSSHRKDTLGIDQFINKLSLNSAMEIHLSKLVKSKSKNTKIKEYAIKAMDASILVYSELKPFADARNITLADSVTFVPDKLISALKKSSGTDFDKKYLALTIENHNNAVSLLERGTVFGDTAVVSFATKQLLVFRRNLEEAKYLAKNLSPGKITAGRPRKKG